MMSSPRSREPGNAFGRHLGLASKRARLEQLAHMTPMIAWVLAVTLLVVLILGLAMPLAAWALDAALVAIIIAAMAAVFTYARPIPRHRLLTRMDLHARLPDSILTTGDWEKDESDAWREGQRRATLRALDKVDWKIVWPVTWPCRATLPLISALILVLVTGLVQQQWHSSHRAMELAQAKINAPVPKEQIKPLEDVFKDWDAAQKIAPSPQLAALLKDVQPLREQMEQGKLTEKQLMLKLNDIQSELQAQRDKMEAQSLSPAADTIADALKNLDSMSALAAALQRKDFAAAADQAAQAQQKYQNGAAKMPDAQSQQAQSSSQKLADASQKASGDKQASSSLDQMKDGLDKGDNSKMGQGLDGLKDSLGQEAQRQSDGRSTDIEMAQLNAVKDGLGNNPGDGKGDGDGQDGNNPGGKGMQLGPITLSLAKSMQPGHGAGSQTDPNRMGDKTSLADHTNEMKLTGKMGQGPSQTQTQSSNDPHMENTASTMGAAQFSDYQKMSDQAIDDENLPVADRQMIKKYFEEIRPAGNP